MAKGNTVTNNSWNDKPARCSDEQAAKMLGGAHPKRQPPPLSPFAPAPSAGGPPLTPPSSVENPDEEE